MVTEVASLIFEADSSDVLTADKNLKKLNQTAPKTEKAVRKLTSGFRVQKNALQNTGLQFQDIIVQMEGGTNASRVFAQQLPQILGAFGALGAFAGVAASAVSILGADFIDSLFESSNAAGNLDDALKDLNDTIKIAKDGTILLSEEFETLARTSRDVAEVQIKARLITAANAANAAFLILRESSEELNLTLYETGNAARGNENRLNSLAKQYGITGSELKELKILTQAAFTSKSREDVKALQDRVTELALTAGKGNDKFTELAQSINEASADFTQQKDIIDQLNLTLSDMSGELVKSGEASIKAAEDHEKSAERRVQALMRLEMAEIAAAEAHEKAEDSRLAQMLKAEQAEIASQERKIGNFDRLQASLNNEFAIALDASNKMKALREAEAEGIISSAEKVAEIKYQIEEQKGQRLARLRQQQLEDQKRQNSAEVMATGDLFIALANITQGESKKSFERSKKLAKAGAAVKGIQAAVNAYEEGSKTSIYLGAAYMAIAAATTGAQIAAIDNQQYSGRRQGGQVRPGTTYKVGEDGPELLTMGSNGGTVTPNSSAANDPKIEVVNNVKVIGSSGEPNVTSSSRQVSDRKIITDVVIDLTSRQSSAVMQNIYKNSTAQPRGNR